MMSKGWWIVFRIGYKLECLGRFFVNRALSHRWQPLRGLGFSDDEAKYFAELVMREHGSLR